MTVPPDEGASAIPCMLWEYIANVLVVVHNAEPIDPYTWDGYTAYCHGIKKAFAGGFANDLVCLIYTQGGAPNAQQRRQHAEAVGHAVVPVALCSASLGMRAVARTVAFLTGHRFKVLSLSQVDEGLDYLQVRDPDLRKRIHDAVERMSEQVGIPPMAGQRTSSG